MARTPAQRGRIGNWLVESRLARGWGTQTDARGEIERLTGWRIPQSVYAEWESGRRVPSPDNLARLEEFYGTMPGGSVTSPDAIVAAIDRLTAAVQDHQRSLSGGIEQLAELVGAALGSLADTRAGTPGERGLRD